MVATVSGASKDEGIQNVLYLDVIGVLPHAPPQRQTPYPVMLLH